MVGDRASVGRQGGVEMNEASQSMAAGGWQNELYDLLRRHAVTQFAYVPDAGADLGGARAVLLMQSSGVGNCINMLSLIKGGRFPFLTLVSMRGDFGEGNPWQYPMGQATQPVLEAMGVICLCIERPEDVIPTTGAALTMAFKGGQAVALLLTQRLIGAKPF